MTTATTTRRRSAKKKTSQPEADNGDLTPDPKTGELFETQKLPAKVKRLAAKYKEASEGKSQANAEFSAARDNLIDEMKETKTPVVIVELGGVRKAIRIDEKDILKIETVKPAAPEAQDVNGKASF